MSVDFFDSNVFIYAADLAHPAKRAVARRLLRNALDSGAGRISFQVVQETLSVLTQKFDPPIAVEDARQLMEDILVPMWRVMPTQSLYERALEIHVRYQYRFYDALIVAAALTGGCNRLLSEDFQHGQRIEGLTIENPFRVDSDE
jgi:predicted nucleic acid-binding protein